MPLDNYHSHPCLGDLRSLALSARHTRSRILDNSQLFSKREADHLVEWVRFDRNTAHGPRTLPFTNSLQLKAHLESRASDPSGHGPCVEIYSVHQRDTWAPLNASRDMISILDDHYSLSSGFLRILDCFRDRYLSTEEGFSGVSRSIFTTNQFEFGWVYKYSEKKQVKSGNPWRIRHTGIYHVYDREQSRTVLFIISPSPTAYFKTYLHGLLQQPQVRSAVLACPMLVHSMLISTHLPSWQEYLEYHETILLRLDTKSACTSLGKPLVTFDTLKEVRDIEKSILPLQSLFTAFDELMHDLLEANRIFTDANDPEDNLFTTIQTALSDLGKEAASYRVQALYMQRRAASTAQSVLDALNLGFQQLGQDQSRNTLIMARSAREDSVAIRAITLVTSFYLPFSFVATVFGMNLVDFDTESRNLVVSRQLWLYFLISVPLTAVTLACWQWRMHKYRQENVLADENPVEHTKSAQRGWDIEMMDLKLS